MALSPAEKQRRYRQRQAVGAMAVTVDCPRGIQADLVAAGYLVPAGVGDEEAIRTALSDLLEDLEEIGLDEALRGNGSGAPR